MALVFIQLFTKASQHLLFVKLFWHSFSNIVSYVNLFKYEFYTLHKLQEIFTNIFVYYSEQYQNVCALIVVSYFFLKIDLKKILCITISCVFC